jgi:hypothetical protein
MVIGPAYRAQSWVLMALGNVLLGAKCQVSDSEQEDYGLVLWK